VSHLGLFWEVSFEEKPSGCEVIFVIHQLEMFWYRAAFVTSVALFSYLSKVPFEEEFAA
jgi:hypothetical protein